MVRRTSHLVVLWILLCGVMMNAMPVLAKTTKETVQTETGTQIVWHRTPANFDDLGMLTYSHAVILDSFADRVCDRKRRPLLRYARLLLTTSDDPQVITAFYQRILGLNAQADVDHKTGIITLTEGAPNDFHLVTITPSTGYCHVQLERVRRYSYPPRQYTAREQQVIALHDSIAEHYQSAAHLTYTVTQRTTSTKAGPQSLNWSVDFERPAHLTVVVTSGKTEVLKITTAGKSLVMSSPGNRDEQHQITKGAITTDLVPALQEDPVAGLMLGDKLTSAEVDYLALLPVANSTTQKLVEMVLTYPEDHLTLRLTIDTQQRLIVRSVATSTTEQEQVRSERTYSYSRVEPIPVTGTAPSQQSTASLLSRAYDR